MAELKADPAFSLFLQTRQDLIKGMPRLRGALQIAIDRHAGALTIEERARDFTAEERDEERYERDMEDWLKETVTERKRQRRLGMEPEKPRKPLYTSVSRSIGTISTKTLFAATASPKQFLEDIAAQFENLAHDPVSQMSKEEKSHFFGFRGKHDAQGSGWRVLVGFGDPSNKGMANLLKQVSILLDRLEEQIDRLAELPALFQPATLSALAAWATANKLAGTYKAGLGTLAFEPDHGKVVEIRMPAAFKVPDKAGIEIVRAALR
ncbi:MAG: hypothetical protein E5X21_28280 [Mesorhizobium sp.]|nr:MAG: hypothetical protein E5X21_28280 [Mesorhizobium sp.]